MSGKEQYGDSNASADIMNELNPCIIKHVEQVREMVERIYEIDSFLKSKLNALFGEAEKEELSPEVNASKGDCVFGNLDNLTCIGIKNLKNIYSNLERL